MHFSRLCALLIDCNTPDIDEAASFWAEALGRAIDLDHPGTRGNYRTDDIGLKAWPCSVLIPCGMGDARNLLMALAGDACLVIGGRAGTISEVCLAWLHRRPLLPLIGCGGWSDQLEQNPPDERGNSQILSWGSIGELERRLQELELVPMPSHA
jgi:SLOG cluster4 family